MSDHDNDTCPHLVRASLLEAENARLKAEVERLRKLFADTERLMLLEGEYEAAKVGTYANLKAEVERLTKDNRQLTKAFEIAEGIIKRMGKAAEDAAKEGKPSV